MAEKKLFIASQEAIELNISNVNFCADEVHHVIDMLKFLVSILWYILREINIFFLKMTSVTAPSKCEKEDKLKLRV